MQIIKRINTASLTLWVQARTAARQMRDKLREKDGSFVDTGLLIVISVVLGALLIAFLVGLFTGKIFPKSEAQVDKFFAMGD